MRDLLRLTCRSLWYHDDLLLDLYPSQPFGAHDPERLDDDEKCYCAEQQPARYEGRCLDQHAVIGDGFTLSLCCRCADVEHRERLAAAGARVAQVIRSGAGAMHRDPAIGRAIAAHRKAGASSTEAALMVSVDLVLAGGGR